jgi:GNAT superfamily N-acetyltransferase
MADRIDMLSNPRPLEPSGMAWAWWRGDRVPYLEPLAGVTVEPATSDAELADLNQIRLAELLRRVRAGHRPYVANIDGQPVAYGWVATREASFGGGRVRFDVPVSYRYLWDFATLPAWRGRGIYPRLLQAILREEAAEAERFWILHEWFNIASQRGIARAGFQAAATLYVLDDGGMGLAPFESSDRGVDGAEFLGLPLLAPVPPPAHPNEEHRA